MDCFLGETVNAAVVVGDDSASVQPHESAGDAHPGHRRAVAIGRDLLEHEARVDPAAASDALACLRKFNLESPDTALRRSKSRRSASSWSWVRSGFHCVHGRHRRHRRIVERWGAFFQAGYKFGQLQPSAVAISAVIKIKLSSRLIPSDSGYLANR